MQDWEDDTDPMPNPVPPPPQGIAKIKEWVKRTFPAGTSVIFRGGGIAIGDWEIPDGVKGEVAEILAHELRIRLFQPIVGDSRYAGIERRLSPGQGVEDLDVYVSFEGVASGMIKSLEDTWGPSPRHIPSYRLPRSQRSRWMKPNARTLGSRAAMGTRFGRTIENPDEVNGTDGRHLDGAMDRYETFHAKSPIRVAELDHDLPTRWTAIGDALSVMYRTDKWKKDGEDIDYKHLHDKGDEKPYEFRKGVRFYEPASEAPKSKVGRGGNRRTSQKSQGLPVPMPRALSMLGYCLGLFVRRYDDEEVYEVNPRGCWLFSSPSGDMLAVYSPSKQPDGSSGFLAVMAGGNLRVLKDGIDG